MENKIFNSRNMKQKSLVLLIAFMAIGSCCKAQELKPVKGVNGKYGYIDNTEKEVIPFKYDYARNFSEGLAAVGLADKYGFIDKTGKIVIPIIYAMVGDFRKGKARVERERVYIKGIRDSNRGVICQYNYINKKGVLLGKWEKETYLYD
jgi:hypothetical protein